jgi:FkbM family methyltransferase
MDIPIIVVCYNNWKYVRNTIEQLLCINPAHAQQIQILDNASTDSNTVEFLNTLPYKIYHNSTNIGPWITPYVNESIYHQLPTKFILTDPDLQYNANLPADFVTQMAQLSDELCAHKLGFALDISDFDKMFQCIYVEDVTIEGWEQQYWQAKCPHPEYEIYQGAIDTTFCLVNKHYDDENYRFRLAGNFTAKHLPWYHDDTIHTLKERYEMSINAPWSTIGTVFMRYINELYHIVMKNTVPIFIEKDVTDPNQNFWTSIFSTWEAERFQIFDAHLDAAKNFIDIGGWIGTTCIYASHKSAHVYVVEADHESIKSLTKNCNTNNRNITIVDNAIYSDDDVTLSFGPNKFRSEAVLNDSTSQIHLTPTSSDCYNVKTITLRVLLERYAIAPSSISLIKVDIEGGEEFILEELLAFHALYSVPLYVSFHYTWWSNPDLTRFAQLTETQRTHIMLYPFISILFN